MPIFEVEQDGQVYEVDAPDIEQAAAAAKAFKPAAPAAPMTPDEQDFATKAAQFPAATLTPQQAAMPPSKRLQDQMGQTESTVWEDFKRSGPGSTLLGLPEVALTSANNAVVDMVGGLTAPFVSEDAEDAAGFLQDFQQQHHRQSQGESAKILTENLGDMFAPVQQTKDFLGDTAFEATGSPDLAATASMAPDFLATILGLPKVNRAAADLPKKPLKPRASETTLPPIVEDLRAADIKVRPSDIEAVAHQGKVPGTKREALKDPADLRKNSDLHNQRRYTDLAAEELGVKAGRGGLDDAALAQAELPAAETYNMVESVLNDFNVSDEFAATFREAAASVSADMPRGKQLSILGVLGKLRQRAARHMQATDEITESKGFAERNLADALEDQIELALRDAGEPQLIKQYAEARERFAKVYDLRAATRAGQVDPAVLWKIDQKSNGRKLSGRLKLIADGYDFAPFVSERGQKMAGRAGKETPDTLWSGIKQTVKTGIGKIPGLDVLGDTFQNTLGKPDPTRVANYGRRTEAPTARGPEQGELDIREALGLEMPPGEVGRAPRRAQPEGAPQDMFGDDFELEFTEGQVGVPPEPQITLQELLGLGEPLNLKKPPGKTPTKLRSTAVEEPSAVQGLLDKYDTPSSGLYTARDMVDDVDALIAEGKAPAELADAVDTFRNELADDFDQWGGRGDMDSAEEAFIEAVRRFSKPQG